MKESSSAIKMKVKYITIPSMVNCITFLFNLLSSSTPFEMKNKI